MAAFFEEHEFFDTSNSFLAASTWEDPAMFCRATEQSWLRLVTTPALHRLYNAHTTTNRDAAVVLADWYSNTRIGCFDAEPGGVRELWLKFADLPSASPKVWMDAYLAAFAVCARVPFVTLDSDFRRFEKSGLELLFLTN